MSSHLCGGDCCQSFFIGATPARIGELYVAVKAAEARGEELSIGDRDVVYIADMIIRIDEDDEAFPRYTCKHFDTTTGRCSAYEQRPAMCRDYPSYGRGVACPNCGFAEACLAASEEDRIADAPG